MGLSSKDAIRPLKTAFSQQRDTFDDIQVSLALHHMDNKVTQI